MRSSTEYGLSCLGIALMMGGIACSKPAPAPQAQAKPSAVSQSAAVSDAKMKIDVEQKRRDEEAAESARRQAEEAAYQNAAKAALQDVHFDYDKSAIREGDKAILQGLADFMKKYPKAKVFIDGNCDERGTVEYNLALGERRAEAVLDYLMGLGVPGDRLSRTSYGKERPVCTESTDSCWFRNRRAHFSLR